jgi:uncharacterized SAM-binding protein YcdF (DUF218 family)
MNGRKTQHRTALPSRGEKRGRFRWEIPALCILLAVPAVPHVLGLRLPSPPSVAADAVIVLSGGEGRIAAGFRAWRRGAGRDFCILGAGRGAKPSQLLPEAHSLSAEALAQVRVEGWSENTLENAFSAKSIAEERKYASVILVTSDYHVPRAYYVFRRVLSPDVAISVIRVGAESGSPPGVAWRWARRHILEGWKYWGYRILLRRD